MKNLQTTGEAFLKALTARDFKQMETFLAPDVKFRALLPPGSFEWSGPAAVIENLASWFGSAEDFEVLDSQVEEVSDGRLRLAYKFRLRPHPFNPGSGWHVIEQQLFCDGEAEELNGIDLLCSGFLPEIENK
ncbi:MAG: hypothetical protein UV10_C0036G0010 [Candidatus Azambacteria bacterium GW2011_GWA1_42_19]|uniref:SnoaL-like domain-containing protein n=1 Tax=Candidatus Azambacteria bacterium GW2011_GWA1_42_19 TaxID=1618609 RepID=A0A0G1BF55_9BACT|nr:MAG: hypothetical protein UV10_C0036G0010 [Candidatus Azambacteria bacterium GW2011_GWA1_42_19]